jgi:hypothetical protein
VFDVIRLGWIVGFVVIFAENGLGDDIFLARPVTQVPQLAAFAAKGKLRMYIGIGWFFANRTTVLHGPFFFFLVPSALSVVKAFSSRVHGQRTGQYNVAEDLS